MISEVMSELTKKLTKKKNNNQNIPKQLRFDYLKIN